MMKATSNQTLLILDDCRLMTRFLQKMLSKQFSIVVSNSPQDALEMLQNDFVPDAILLDYAMDEMNGSEFLKIVKAKYPEIPSVVLSGTKEAAVRIDCLISGADDFVSKPFHPKELELRISRVFGNSLVFN